MDAWLTHKKIIISAGLVLLVLVLALGYLLLSRKGSSPSQELTEVSMTAVAEETASQGSQELRPDIYVDIKGAVVKPGMYQVSEQARLLDVVELAGGFTDQAETLYVNFSQLVQDQMVIFIPKIGEEVPEGLSAKQQTEGEGKMPDSQDTQEEKINLNLADSQELQRLTGIGEKKAEAIINYREEHGSFKKVDELTNVSGFGQKTVEKLKEQLTV